MRLPGMDPPHQIRPNAERPTPAFWIRHIRVLRELATGDEYVVRDVELRRGLNIVWAPPHSPGKDNVLFRDGVAGHTAGKSTFCRLLRYVLGERGFAPDSVRRRIRSEFPKGWVVAEVLVSDVSWIVARPLGIGPRPFCCRGGDIRTVAETIERLDYQDFLNALGSATTAHLSAARFPASDLQVCWDHVLPWLARDQECRFADFVEWRHSSSDSEAPSLNVDERQFIVRAVLGLISDAERVEQQRNARLVTERKEAARLEPLLRHQAETDRGRLSRELGKDLPLVSTPLFTAEARAELARRRADRNAREKVLKQSHRREELQTALDEANQAEGSLRESLKEARHRFDVVQAAVSELAGGEQSGLLACLPPSRGFCNVPLRYAREKGCPIAMDHPAELAAKRGERSAVQELAAEREVAAWLEHEVKRLEEALGLSQARTRAARRTLFKAQTDYEEARAELQEETSRLRQLDRLVETADEAAREAASKAEVITQLTREIDESYKLQDDIREVQKAAISRFSTRFDYVVRALIGDRVTGRVDTSGRSLVLTVEEHGERDSAAITTVKLLAFDLASVLSSIEGDGAYPRFLIHDGPREADMALDVYEHLFLFAHELEKCFKGEPAFQYILTTTTEPPEKFAVGPWLRLQLAGVPADGRLLRCDL